MARPAPINLAEVPTGYRFPPVTVEMSPARVAAYRRTLQAEAIHGPGGEELVSPSAATALAMGALLERIALPPGALHTAQEVSMHGPLPVRTAALCHAELTGHTSRKGSAFFTLEFSLSTPAGAVVLNAKTTLFVTEEQRS